MLTDEDDPPLSPAEERAIRAEKRAAWRAARLKSLEQDAMQAQMVIKSMTDMVGTGDGGIAKDSVNTIKEEVRILLKINYVFPVNYYRKSKIYADMLFSKTKSIRCRSL